jgi:hypothetical protein
MFIRSAALDTIPSQFSQLFFWSLPFRFPDQNFANISHFTHMHYVLLTLSSFGLIILTISSENYELLAPLYVTFIIFPLYPLLQVQIHSLLPSSQSPSVYFIAVYGTTAAIIRLTIVKPPFNVSYRSSGFEPVTEENLNPRKFSTEITDL